jgi:hypothetical protein
MPKKVLKTVGLILGVLIVGVLAILVSFIYQVYRCDNTEQLSSFSPDRQWRVVLHSRSCGGTMGTESSEISILGHYETLTDEPGNIYSNDGYPILEEYLFDWLSTTSLKIEGTHTDASRKLQAYNGITIEYRNE